MDGTRARATLGLAEHATQQDLRRAFRERAFATHPDHGGDSSTFVSTLNAFRALATTPVLSSTDLAPAGPASPAARGTGPRIDTYDCTPAPRRQAPSCSLSFEAALHNAIRERVAAQ